MALITQFNRADGTAVQLHWGWWHLDRFQEAYLIESGDDVEVTFTSLTEYTYTQEHTFTDDSDGEVLEIHVGDVFRWWRDR